MRSSRLNALKIGAALLMLQIVAIASLGAETTQRVNPEGRAELTLTISSSDEVRVSLMQMKLSDSFPYKNALLWGGDVDKLPGAALTSIQIQERNTAIFVPLSAYSDLGDVKLASLSASGRGFVLNLHGGNTASAYDAALTFSRGYLVRRTVKLREFPDERVENTTYSYPKGEGE